MIRDMTTINNLMSTIDVFLNVGIWPEGENFKPNICTDTASP